jgi:hypothetical protein
MQYLVQMKIVPEGRPKSVEEGEIFFKELIRPTLELCKKLANEEKILAGGPISGTIGLALVVKADSAKGTGRSRDQPAGVAANGNRDYSAYEVRGPRAIDRAQAERFTSQAIGVLTRLVLPELFNEAKEGL